MELSLCLCQFGWNWPSTSLNSVNILLLFHNYLPVEGTWPFIWPNLNPLYPRMLCIRFDRTFLNFVNYIFAISQLFSPRKGHSPSFEKKTLKPLNLGMLCGKFNWYWPNGSGEDENVKSLKIESTGYQKRELKRETGNPTNLSTHEHKHKIFVFSIISK